ncbi:MAG: hypothetical protein HQ555_02380 [Candidatus Aminicenantes bacterium]|nr:hypothetical protein [Candidatus Aminicenantes bacterium]
MSKEKQKSDPVDRLVIINDELHKVLCEAIITLLQDTLEEPGITEEEIKAAREFTELKPDTEAVKELIRFIESKEVKEALIINYSS